MTMPPVAIHTIFEASAYFIGFRYFLVEKRRLALPALTERENGVWIGVAAIVGAALGAKIGFWIEDPLAAFADFPNVRHLLEGKTIVGALLGGLVSVETAKRLLGVTTSSGDAFALPLLVGIAIGRIGCFFAGLDDHTYGNPTALPWGVDFGDGVARHPTQLYEIAFLIVLGALLVWRRAAFTRTGDLFRAFMIAYLLFRFAIDAIKPIPYAYFGGPSGIQLLCVCGLLYYLPHFKRIASVLAWGRS